MQPIETLEVPVAGIGEQAGRARQAEVADHELARGRCARAQSLEVDTRLHQRRGQGHPAVGMAVAVRLPGLAESARPDRVEALQVALRDLDSGSHETGSTRVGAMRWKADSARRQDSSSRVTT